MSKEDPTIEHARYRELQLDAAIAAYLKEKTEYNQRFYGDSAATVSAGEGKMIMEAREAGRLSTWKPGDDILVCITEAIKKSVTEKGGAISLGTAGFREKDFSQDVWERLEKAQKGEPGYYIVSMNDARTVELGNNGPEHIEILSPGQGGCTQVVLMGRKVDGTLETSVFHFDLTVSSRLVETIGRESAHYEGAVNAKAVVIISGGTDEVGERQRSAIEGSLRLVPNLSDISFSNATSQNAGTDNLLEVSVKRSGNARVLYKGTRVCDWKL